ncbi:MAG: aminoacyl-tRNA hydrolase [Calditrichaeota bacterium]|nr:MAG: aminoacyl-tRNA hydrolase [Calditrichota bacterium]MBL1207479.1 aminoacyl-tRNA hydrolase [Calditrichota bacterium]NOG47311.1 aminoacyl-tRNA hydrolase [Calditrichota bacterium]
MCVIIGLGNPGKKYSDTRHNAGFLLIDFIAEKFNIPLCEGKGDYYFGEYEISGRKCLLIKPTTYMNLSGLVFDQIEEDFSIDLQKMLIVYDDFHLPFGTIRFRKKGSDAGHNGIKSMIYYLATDEFDRLKIGIDNNFETPIDHVLGSFNKKELTDLPKILNSAYNGIETWISSGIDLAMNNHNRNILNSTR